MYKTMILAKFMNLKKNAVARRRTIMFLTPTTFSMPLSTMEKSKEERYPKTSS